MTRPWIDNISLTVVLAVAGAVGGCERDTNAGWRSANGPARVCVDAEARRTADDACAAPRSGGGVSPFLWYYLGRLNAPAPYGAVVGGGSYRATPGVAYGRVPSSGITRGGFGGTAASFGGGEGAGE